MSDIQAKLFAAFQVEHREHLQAVRAMLSGLARAAYDTTGFDFVEAHRRVHSLKGAARVVGLRPVETLSHALETLMSRSQAGAVHLDREACEAVHAALDAIEDYVAAVAGEAPATMDAQALAGIERLLGGVDDAGEDAAAAAPAPGTGPPPADAGAASPGAAPAGRDSGAGFVETVRVNVDSVDAVFRHAAETLGEAVRQQHVTQALQTAERTLRDLAQAAGGGPPAELRERLDRALVELRTAGRLQRDSSWRVAALGAQLYREARALRIVPAESVFGGVRKMVRDLAQSEGKRIEVEVGGLDVQADRQVLQALKDPVVHLLRNAVAHGIETPEARLARGKPAAGRVTLEIETRRNRLLIRVADDGAGLDLDRIREEAARRGLKDPRADADTDGGDLATLLARPGFTTVRSVGELAGRGIGLSIVDRAVNRLQGRFDLAPRAGGGVVATIAVPLTVSGHRLLLVQAGGQTYAVPAHGVERLCRVRPQEIVSVQGEPVFTPRPDEEPVALASLARLLGHDDGTAGAPEAELSVVLLRVERRRLGLAVDAFAGVQDGVIHELEAVLPGLELAAGAAVLGDGSLATVLNPAALLRAAAGSRGDWGVELSPPPPATPPLILVVDDSVTTRTLEKSILAARGFRVRLSMDGLDALDQLRQERPALVIADIEMPRLDGFGLLQAMKADEALAGIPVILVTSRDSAQDRRKGLALGAEAYIVKQRFDQRELLEAIEQIL